MIWTNHHWSYANLYLFAHDFLAILTWHWFHYIAHTVFKVV